ncbi:GntR family transcriptional regulator [Virgibacillus profundi]|uniref:GntR family transcriptional regulator n=1 Tax=Virgibacillus profundi TaxID=2024555 RepID=A0A2A2IA00_9BACI|nr:GntR family transcriptional regulator [Virgibacillus profundi]PAV28402.1 GntR family transcriptional regulator [Virgibacillus profundi]PXY52236.1 GntR family transcriptional regulator [Virgibacillus profundi]
MKKIIQNESLAAQAYNLLKKSIISGEFSSNEELPEEKLAKYLGISRTPIREALMQLSMEGLLVLQKGRPARVATFSVEESLHFIELRRVLEIYNIEKVTLKVEEKLISELKENINQQLKAISKNDYQNFIEFDREFHLILASENENKKIGEMIHQMNNGVNRAFLILSNTLISSAQEAYEEHLRLIKALENKDVTLARESMIEHMDNVEKRFIKNFSKVENSR